MIPTLLILLSSGYSSAQPSYLHIPMNQRGELLNGLKLVVVERQNQPTATVLLVTFAGSNADESGKAGTASLTAKMLLAATPQRKRAQITDDLAGEGLTASSYADYDASWFRVSGPAKDVRTMVEEMSDLLLTSNFDEKELAQLKEETKDGLLGRHHDAAALAELYFREKLYGMHPYGFPPEGVPRMVNDVSAADCLKFYQKYYHPNNAMMLVVGGVKSDDIETKVRVSLGGWKNTPSPPIFPKTAKQPVGVQIRLVDRPGSDPAQILLGRIGGQRTSRDYYNLEMLNFILGGEGFASRFAERLQKKDHLASNVSSGFEYHLSGGEWKVRLSTASANAPAALADVIDEIKRIRDTRVSDQDLAAAVSAQTSQITSRIQSNDQIADALAGIEIYNLAFDTYTAYTAHLSRVSAEQVQQAARAFLDPDSLVVVVVGNAAEMKEGLEKLGSVEVFPGA
ncbi:MAG: insulinase family protein [Acidobacteriia bacterium]|nr:insulinase family protein [Terriglobia bacterium]